MKKEVLNYSEAIIELEEILDQIENSELNVDDLIIKVKRAAKLVEICKAKLFSIEKEVEDVLNDIN